MLSVLNPYFTQPKSSSMRALPLLLKYFGHGKAKDGESDVQEYDHKDKISGFIHTNLDVVFCVR